MITGSIAEFKRKFENPILRGRDADASDEMQKKGEEKGNKDTLLPFLVWAKRARDTTQDSLFFRRLERCERRKKRCCERCRRKREEEKTFSSL